MRHRELTVVARADHERVLGEAVGIERIQHLDDLRIHLLIQVSVKACIGQLPLAR